MSLEEAATYLGLNLNTEKTQYMLTGSKMEDKGTPLVIGGHKFQKVEKFKNPGSLVTEDNIMAKEIKEWISTGNRCYFALQGIFKCKNISRSNKIRLYKTVLKTVVMHGPETCVTEEEWLQV